MFDKGIILIPVPTYNQKLLLYTPKRYPTKSRPLKDVRVDTQ